MRSPLTMLVLLLVFVAATVASSLFAYVRVRDFAIDTSTVIKLPAFDGKIQPTSALFAPSTDNTATPAPTTATVSTAAATVVQQANGVSTQAAAPTQSPQVVVVSQPKLAPTRITILLLGIDQRKGEKGPFRTDTIILLSIDPIRKTGVILSIPRDIYIDIPGFDHPDRINNANAIGEMGKYPEGGPGLTVKTVQSLLGVPIQRYVMINFDAFSTVMDTVGPVQVCPDKPIHDTAYPDGSYGFITVDFPAGCQQLDSTKLLQYARVRHNAGDDFGRAGRQQEVIRAVREKVLTAGAMTSLVAQAGPLWEKLKDSVKTNLSLDEMIQLAQIAQTIPKENIQSAVITDRDGYLLPATLSDGSQVFSPIYEKIHSLVTNLFDATPGSTVVNSDATSEGAKIVVSNGAGVDGMAKSIASKLQDKGFIVIDAKNADLPGGYAKTIIRVYTGKFKTAKYLADTLGIDGSSISDEKNKGGNGVDIEVVVGKDLAPKTQ